jgi:hypothetical protein
MRFIIGALVGFAIGLAGAILFAPEKRRTGPWPEGHPARSLNGDQASGFRGALRTLQDHVNEAWEEARLAAEESEKEMMARYQEARTAADAEADIRAIFEEESSQDGDAKKAAKKAAQAAKKAEQAARKAEEAAKKQAKQELRKTEEAAKKEAAAKS